MARTIGKLSALSVKSASNPGMYADGGGLYLQIGPTGAKSWIFRFMLNGRAREMGLGPLHATDLATARRKANECRSMRVDGIDPIEERRKHREQARLAAAKAITFEDAALAYIAGHQDGWKNEKHISQWRNTLATYAYPVFGSVSVQDIDVALVMKVLDPIWKPKTETASRLRGRIETVLDWATVRGYRKGDNPARWRGFLENALQDRSKLTPVEHHAALPYGQMSAFMVRLKSQEGAAAIALRFLILTITRTNEVIGAQWPEFDFGQKLWVIPPHRMKAGKEHRVPLSDGAIAILHDLKEGATGTVVFRGRRQDQPLSNMAMLSVLRRMERSDLTVHGFRSTFRDWAAEQTSFPREVAEMALAHTIGDKVEAAYRRGELIAKRSRLMTAWDDFCHREPKSASILSISSPIRA